METAIVIIVTIILIETSAMLWLKYRTIDRHAGEMLLDTSVLIDGRIEAIARSGLLNSTLVVPKSVVRELQFMADKADHDKRERARSGLAMIESLQHLPSVTVKILDDKLTSQHGVDEQLMNLATARGAKLCTIDYNLNKAARVQGVEVVNINELAHALRVIHLPGETVSVLLVQPGQDKKQAVGYLDDGTMMVVDDARELIGNNVDVEITRALQTAAGRMMFARLVSRVSAKNGSSNSDRTVPSQSSKKPDKRSSRRKTPEDTLVNLANKK